MIVNSALVDSLFDLTVDNLKNGFQMSRQWHLVSVLLVPQTTDEYTDFVDIQLGYDSIPPAIALVPFLLARAM